ncbi:MAG: MlaD family protein [Myxococcota bacterium]|jgi:paraquat-inducible protein B|nr:MlaD family protein [Myxococcota bacterium]
MSEPNGGLSQEEVPEAVVAGRHGFQIVWLVPIIAALVALALLYATFERRGKSIEITFADASGVDAGKTTVRYRDVVIGTVEEVRLSKDFSHIIVKAQIDENGERLLVGETSFWIERPRIGPKGISGLTTIVSGAYIAVDPGKLGGPLKRSFEGLADPPDLLKNDKGLHLTLTSMAGTLGLSQGSPVIYKGIRVGQVTSLKLGKPNTGATIQISIKPAYADRVHSHTHFWNSSGVDISASLQGIDVDIASIATALTGGVSFDTLGEVGKPAVLGDQFTLFDHEKDASREYRESRGLHILLRTPRLESVTDGDSILYRGAVVGRVLSHDLDENGRDILLRVQIDSRYATLVRENSVFWNASGIHSDLGFTGLHVQVSSLEALIKGAVAFATPDKPGKAVEAGALFDLAKESKGRWLKWSPLISLPPGETTAP